MPCWTYEAGQHATSGTQARLMQGRLTASMALCAHRHHAPSGCSASRCTPFESVSMRSSRSSTAPEGMAAVSMLSTAATVPPADKGGSNAAAAAELPSSSRRLSAEAVCCLHAMPRCKRVAASDVRAWAAPLLPLPGRAAAAALGRALLAPQIDAQKAVM
jgi:hypothetical protein